MVLVVCRMGQPMAPGPKELLMKTMQTNQKGMAPVDFLLHVREYYIDTLEIYIADLSLLSIRDIDLSGIRYYF